MAVAFIKGLQGDDPKYLKAIATPKDFAVRSGPESSRHQFEVEVSERDLKETYLPAFRASIVEGKADSVMCASGSVNGMPLAPIAICSRSICEASGASMATS